MTIGTITGGITLNPIILVVINGCGIVVTNIGKMKNYKKKIEMSKIAFTTYEKVLVELRSALRGDEFYTILTKLLLQIDMQRDTI